MPPRAMAASAKSRRALSDEHERKDDEERVLAAKARRGDLTAIQRLATMNMHIVESVARRYQGYRLSSADLVQEGNIGLMEAVRRYDPKKGPLTAYVRLWADAMIMRYVQDNFGAMRSGGRRGRKLFWSLRREQAKLEAQTGERDQAALAIRLGVTEAEVDDVQVAMGSTGELTEAADLAVTPDTICETNELYKAVRQRVASLGLQGPEHTVLERRILPFDGEQETLASVAMRYGVTKQRVEQIEKRLRKRLRVELADLVGAAA